MASPPENLQTVDEFWRWALVQWRRADLSTVLLDLQNQHGLVVLELLLLAWLGHRGHRLELTDWQRMVSHAQPWIEDVIVPLRSTRQRWRDRSTVTTLRPLLADIELRAERQLAQLYVKTLDHLDHVTATDPVQQESHLQPSPLSDNLHLGISRAQPALPEQKITEILRLLQETDAI